jgi:hypothetical protein
MRLEPKPIIDPREPGDTMRGNPLSRAASADGRWAYTLYDGGGARPFIHALDTAHATARCIDLNGLAPAILSRLRLRIGDGGRAVQITDGVETLATLDTHTFTISSNGINAETVVQPGSIGTVTFTVPASATGTIQFFCRFHVSRGMKGTLNVT